ncbi:hypothetical protein [Desulfitobacterium sp. AusDCA]|uniref:hypothetical protein n=1 Tax=Desulfitobacterium sp. AusDCA TaxID=3240383 RepID=UPI003DA75CA2
MSNQSEEKKPALSETIQDILQEDGVASAMKAFASLVGITNIIDLEALKASM